MTDSPAEDPEQRIIERTVDTSGEQPNYRVLETIAEAEGVNITTLPPMYERIDHMLDKLFSDPPATEAQVEVTFSYHGYRITAKQDGSVILRRLSDEGISS